VQRVARTRAKAFRGLTCKHARCASHISGEERLRGGQPERQGRIPLWLTTPLASQFNNIGCVTHGLDDLGQAPRQTKALRN
jgi:hypothetical protein